MNPYELIKDNVTVPQAAERYGLATGRNSMVCCLFHEDHHPSMKLNERYFYCFGCGAHGDVIDLTARLLGTSTKDTIDILLNDYHLDPRDCPAKPMTTRRPMIRNLREEEEQCFSVLNEFHRLLESWRERYAPSGPEEPMDDHYILVCREMDGIEYILDILTVGSLEDRVKLVDDLIKTGKLARLRQAMNDIKKEGDRHEEARAS